MPAAFRTRQRVAAVDRLVDRNRVFQDYLGLPQELRTMVINRMKPRTRLRFADCSNICREDVLKSKNIIEKITLHAFSRTDIECAIDYANPNNVEMNQFFGFKLVFRKREDIHTMDYVRMNETRVGSRTLWTSRLDSTTDDSVAILKFKTLLKNLRHKVKHIRISGNGFENLEQLHSNAVSMRNIESIFIFANMDIHKFLEKTHQPLKVLSYSGKNYIDSAPNCALVNSSKQIALPYVHFTYEQLVKISAEKININIGQLSVKNIFDYIKGWMNGERNNLKQCSWLMTNPDFNVRELFAAFNHPIPSHDPRPDDIHAHFEVYQTSNPRMIATVQYMKSGPVEKMFFITWG